MHTLDDETRSLHSAAKDFPLHEYRLRLAGRLWTILHTGAMLTPADERHFFRQWRRAGVADGRAATSAESLPRCHSEINGEGVSGWPFDLL